jgi:hypothetical protein
MHSTQPSAIPPNIHPVPIGAPFSFVSQVRRPHHGQWPRGSEKNALPIVLCRLHSF